ncbi:uncharacterized protein B0P05DRAFT_554013 [Gilbertella persicaria]|uniref:uncharacterized protein n=1 Tax=Gilbertella persicaria TaxID=101096 RepID=UPI00221FA881|nr:uncharacterized protein B0P05DRAFT_554013 [Gilbertella persicaria]KAI8065355.1 hypothetical protein B0P05DRAFT_554013 [Gilbertella persicaria]
MTLSKEFTKLNIKDTEETTRSCSQLEIDNAYLKQQNQHLNRELSFARYTINALKGIANQRDVALDETRQELEKALQHIQLLTCTLRQQQRYSNLSGIGLVQDTDLSDDQELSEEDEFEEQKQQQQQAQQQAQQQQAQQQRRRPTVDIMSKLPLRQPPSMMTDQIFMPEHHHVNDAHKVLLHY